MIRCSRSDHLEMAADDTFPFPRSDDLRSGTAANPSPERVPPEPAGARDPGSGWIPTGPALFLILSVICLFVVVIYAVAKDTARLPTGELVDLDPGEVVLPADGRSNLPGNLASLEYEPTSRDQEFALDSNDGAGETRSVGPHSGAYWHVVSAAPNRKLNRLEVDHIPFDFLATRKHLEPLLRRKEEQNSWQAGYDVEFKREKIGGRTAYTMDYVTRDGWMMSRAWFFAPEHSYRVFCNYAPGSSVEEFEECIKATKSFRIHDGGPKGF